LHQAEQIACSRLVRLDSVSEVVRLLRGVLSSGIASFLFGYGLIDQPLMFRG